MSTQTDKAIELQAQQTPTHLVLKKRTLPVWLVSDTEETTKKSKEGEQETRPIEQQKDNGKGKIENEDSIDDNDNEELENIDDDEDESSVNKYCVCFHQCMRKTKYDSCACCDENGCICDPDRNPFFF